ncbi:MAG TPA: carbon-nitrogen hydrolase family protein [Labilithrix sp.]|nr:carbon-nitrogen hydrolase family protein [Labilithrix sp.]
MQVAVIQLSSQDDVNANLARMRELVLEAGRCGAELVALPENFAFMGEEAKKLEIAESIDAGPEGPILAALRGAAREAGVFLVAGGMPERSGDPARPFNTSLLIEPGGRLVGTYRKVHLFDVDLPDGTKLLESAATTAGGEPSVNEISGRAGTSVGLGMTICYDLRFPELYRRLGERGVRIVTVPAAFTLTTGKDHWHVLLRARAIENQVFVLAPAQHGKHPRGRQTYGKSLVVDPWGDVLAQCAEGEGFAMARLDFAAQDRVRASLPCLTHRRM